MQSVAHMESGCSWWPERFGRVPVPLPPGLRTPAVEQGGPRRPLEEGREDTNMVSWDSGCVITVCACLASYPDPSNPPF